MGKGKHVGELDCMPVLAEKRGSRGLQESGDDNEQFFN
jgi:hypothetical protein